MKHQIFRDFEYYSVGTNQLDQIPLAESITSLEGEYCLMLNAGDILRHDHILEEIFQHEVTEDFIFCNIAFSHGNQDPEQYLIHPENIRYKDLISVYKPYQGIFFKQEIFKKYSIEAPSLIQTFYVFLINAIVQERCSFSRINALLTNCRLDPKKINAILFPNQRLLDILASVIPLQFEDYNELLKLQDERYVLAGQIVKSSLFQAIRLIRKSLHFLAYYRLKSKLSQSNHLRTLKKEDKKRRKMITQNLSNLPKNKTVQEDLIVSLTSHSSRVSQSAPYAIYSILNQNLLPERLILNLDEEKWNTKNLPPLIKELQEFGLEVHFCKDIGPHTKLLPTLKRHSNKVIITLDDDIYYYKTAIEELFEDYLKSNKKEVICRKGAIAEKRLGCYIAYTHWKSSFYGNTYSNYIAHGVGGVLYPPNLFGEEIFDEALIKKTCPFEDDMWFWYIETKENLPIRIVQHSTFPFDEYVDRTEQYVAKNSSALHHKNHGKKRSDIQLDNLIRLLPPKQKE